MLFDPSPKEQRKDLYDRDEELNSFIRYIGSSSKIIVVTGFRRSGKTSLIKVGLNMTGLPYVLIDTRGLRFNYSYKELLRLIEISINSFMEKYKNTRDMLLNLLKSIKGVGVYGFNVYFKWGGMDRLDLNDLFNTLDKLGSKIDSKIVVALDEAQALRGKLGRIVASLIAHSYDYHDNIIYVLTGSQIGLLYSFIGINDPNAPLYGRHISEVKLNNFPKDLSISFLKEGFKELGMNYSDEVLEYAYEKLDGIVGWLTEFGYRCYELNVVDKKVVDNVVSIGIKLAKNEFKHFLKERGIFEKRYVEILKAIASNNNTWSKIKQWLEEKLKERIPDKSLSRLLDNLMKATIIEKITEDNKIVYKITDPLLKEAYRPS
ncbi:MAG: AAA family ATPase [Thermoprotei archaeon]